MLIQEVHINASEGYVLGDSEPYETAPSDTPGDVFRAFRREYGACLSSQYVDTKNGPKRIGWVFSKRRKYEDSNDTYKHEVWVTLHKKPPTRTVTYHYLEI